VDQEAGRHVFSTDSSSILVARRLFCGKDRQRTEWQAALGWAAGPLLSFPPQNWGRRQTSRNRALIECLLLMMWKRLMNLWDARGWAREPSPRACTLRFGRVLTAACAFPNSKPWDYRHASSGRNREPDESPGPTTHGDAAFCTHFPAANYVFHR